MNQPHSHPEIVTPCAFPLLPAYLTQYYTASPETPRRGRLGAILSSGLLTAVGSSLLLIKNVSGVILIFVGLFLLSSALFVQTFTRLFIP